MKKISLFSDQLRAVWMLAFVAIALVFATPLFLQPSNMLNVLLTAAVVALIAAGQTYVIILAEIDLSVAERSESARAVHPGLKASVNALAPGRIELCVLDMKHADAIGVNVEVIEIIQALQYIV